MIVTSEHELTIGKVYRPGDDGLMGITAADYEGTLRIETEFAFLVIRKASLEEYREYWAGTSNDPNPTDQHYYLVSMD